MLEFVLGWVFQILIPVVFRLKIYDQTIIFNIFDDVGHVHQLLQCIAGDGVGSFYPVCHNLPPFVCVTSVLYSFFKGLCKVISIILSDLGLISVSNQKITNGSYK